MVKSNMEENIEQGKITGDRTMFYILRSFAIL